MEISNEEVNVGSSFDSIFSRVNDVAKTIQNKKTLYDRAGSISSGGTLATDRLEGALDAMVNRMNASVSSWYTDDDGNIIFEAADGSSAMKLSGDGFVIADGKKENGDWRWRTAGNGKGLVADTITAGYLSADRIQASSITANKLASDVGANLDLESNKSIHLMVKDVVDGRLDYKMRIDALNGTFITDPMQRLEFKAVFTRDGQNVTYDYEDRIEWYIDGDIYEPASMNISVDMARIKKDSVEIECRLIIPVPSGKQDKYGNDIMVDRMFFDTVTVATTVNRANIDVYVTSNHPYVQMYDPNGSGELKPDWSSVPLVLRPAVFIDSVLISDYARYGVQVLWSKMSAKG